MDNDLFVSLYEQRDICRYNDFLYENFSEPDIVRFQSMLELSEEVLNSLQRVLVTEVILDPKLLSDKVRLLESEVDYLVSKGLRLPVDLQKLDYSFFFDVFSMKPIAREATMQDVVPCTEHALVSEVKGLLVTDDLSRLVVRQPTTSLNAESQIAVDSTLTLVDGIERVQQFYSSLVIVTDNTMLDTSLLLSTVEIPMKIASNFAYLDCVTLSIDEVVNCVHQDTLIFFYFNSYAPESSEMVSLMTQVLSQSQDVMWYVDKSQFQLYSVLEESYNVYNVATLFSPRTSLSMWAYFSDSIREVSGGNVNYIAAEKSSFDNLVLRNSYYHYKVRSQNLAPSEITGCPCYDCSIFSVTMHNKFSLYTKLRELMLASVSISDMEITSYTVDFGVSQSSDSVLAISSPRYEMEFWNDIAKVSCFDLTQRFRLDDDDVRRFRSNLAHARHVMGRCLWDWKMYKYAEYNPDFPDAGQRAVAQIFSCGQVGCSCVNDKRMKLIKGQLCTRFDVGQLASITVYPSNVPIDLSGFDPDVYRSLSSQLKIEKKKVIKSNASRVVRPKRKFRVTPKDPPTDKQEHSYKGEVLLQVLPSVYRFHYGGFSVAEVIKPPTIRNLRVDVANISYICPFCQVSQQNSSLTFRDFLAVSKLDKVHTPCCKLNLVITYKSFIN